MLYVGSFHIYREDEGTSINFIYFAGADDPKGAVDIFKAGIRKTAEQPDTGIYGKIYLASIIVEMTEDDGFGHLGVLCGHDVIGPRQFVAARNEWIKPRHEAFQPRNGWSLYNAVTEVLKSSPPQEVMERHVELHDCFKAFAAPQQTIAMAEEAGT